MKKNERLWKKIQTYLFKLAKAGRASLNHANTFSETLLSPEILFIPSITVMMFSSAASNDFVAALT